MRIPVKFPHYSDDLGQWVLVVLQGELLPEEVGHPCAAGPFGELSWAEPEEGESEGKVQLIVGSHILFGRVEELKEPFLLFKKVVRKRDKFEFDDSDDSDAEAENAPVQLKAQGVIKVQIVFNTPPRPVISTPTEGEVLGTTADPQQDVSSTQSMTRRKVKRLKKTPVYSFSFR
ncbi:MAG: hypothetical protein MHM6MM_008081, partial [Cercozoa sp. M6MM]